MEEDYFHCSDGTLYVNLPENYPPYVAKWSFWRNARMRLKHRRSNSKVSMANMTARLRAIYPHMKIGKKKKPTKSMGYEKKIDFPTRHLFYPGGWSYHPGDWPQDYRRFHRDRKNWALHKHAKRELIANYFGYTL